MNEKETVARIQILYGVFFIDSKRDEKMANALERREYPNEGLLKVTRSFVNGRSIVVDIGAHIGTFAIPIAAVVGKVIAFEPSPETFALLSRNAKENNVPLQLVNKALGSEKGSGTLVVRNTSNAGANTFMSGGNIPVATLDNEVSHADFIKMDVEGMEIEVLRGGTRLIEHSRPVVLFEVNLSQLRAHNTSPRALQCFFVQRGYRLYYPLEGRNMMLARVYSTTLLTAFIAPRAWLFFGDSAPFDLVAVPQERALPCPITGFTIALVSAFKNNLLVKMRRMRVLIR